MRTCDALRAVLVVVLALMARPLHARPVFDSTCSNCHTPTTGRLELTNHQGIFDPGPGSRKTYIVNAGSSARLTARVLDGAQAYAVALKDLGRQGILNSGNQISFTPDSDWIEWGDPPYYITTEVSTPWGGSPTDWDFDLLVSEQTPPDFYSFQFTTSGRDESIWTQSEAFYVQVLPVPEPAVASAIMTTVATLLLRRRSRRRGGHGWPLT